MNPGSHAPQACILDQARRRPHRDTCFSEPIETDQAIIKTLTFLRNSGKPELAIKQANWKLRQIAEGKYELNGQDKTVDIFNSESVKEYIANHKKRNGEPPKASLKNKYISNQTMEHFRNLRKTFENESNKFKRYSNIIAKVVQALTGTK